MNRGYQRYGRLNFIWKNDGVYNNPDSNCLGSDQGIRLTINMIAAGGHSTGKIWDSFDGHFEAWTTVPDCGIVGGLDPVQPWVTKEDCVRGVALHEFGHALGFLHDNQAPGNVDSDPTGATGPAACTHDDDAPGYQFYGDNGASAHMSRMNICGGLIEAEAEYWSNHDLFPVEIAGIQRAYGRRIPGSLLSTSGYCMDSLLGATSGDPVSMDHCNESGDTQEWEWIPQANASGQLRRYTSSLCLRASPTGAQATTTTCDSTSSYQRFELKEVRVRGWGGLCLHLEGANTNGGSVTVRGCDGSANQRWTYWYDASTLGDRLRYGDGSTAKCLEFGANGASATVKACSATTSQIVTFTANGQIKMNNGNSCLDIAGVSDATYLTGTGQPTAGSAVETFACATTEFSQRWNITGRLHHPASGLCLRRSDGAQAGSAVKVATCTTSTGMGGSDWDFYPRVVQ